MKNDYSFIWTRSVDGRHFNGGRGVRGANASFSRSKLAMALIGESTEKSFSQLKTHTQRKNFWRAVEWLRGKTNNFNKIGD